MSSRRERPDAPDSPVPPRAHPVRYEPHPGKHEGSGARPAAPGRRPETAVPHLLASTEMADENEVAATGNDDSDASVMRTSGSIALATLVSRVTGFIRTVLVLAMLGGVASAFQAAYVLPNMIAEVVLGAVLTAIVIPVLVRAEAEDDDRGEGFINRIFTLALLVLGVATVIALVAAPLLTVMNVSGDGKVDRPLVTALAYLLLPEIFFYGLSALFMALLNVKNIFKPGAWAPVLNNIVQIATLILFAVMPGKITLNPVQMSDPKLLVLGVGTTIGVIVQAAILVPYLRTAGIRLRIKWGIDARLRRFGNMALAIITYVLILQVGLVITYNIASSATGDGIAAYATSWQLLQLPYGVLGVTILTAIMPRLSRNAAAQNRDAVIDDMSLATRLTMLALVPTVTFMTFFGPAIGVAIFNFGEYTQKDASQLGSVLAWGAFTLIPYAMTLVQLRVFYAREDAWTPTLMVFGITIVKVVASYLGTVLFDDPDMVVRWLALSNGLGYLVGAVVGHYLLYKRLGNARMTHVMRTSWLTFGVSLVVTAAVWAVTHLTHLNRMSLHAGKIGSIAYLALTGVVVLGVIYLFLVALRIPDMVTISDSVMRLVGRFIPALAPAPRSAAGDTDAATMTVQFPRVSGDEGLPYSGQVEVRRRFDRGSASWQEYAVTSGGAAGETAVLPRIGADPLPPGRGGRTDRSRGAEGGYLPSQMPTRTVHQKPSADAAAEPAQPRTGQPPMTQTPPASTPPRGPRLVPGAAIAGGRYRLLEPHGGTRGLQFWRAKDTQLDREVGLTFVDPEQQAPPYRPEDRDTDPDGPQAILNRTRRLGQLHTAGIARVLDVVRGASGGIVVTEWVPGSSLAEVADSGPSATGAARAVRALAAAAEAAHRAGAALSIDHPDRIRVSLDGDAVLAFPAVLADDDRASDVRGLGAVLYALLLDRWPLDGATGHTVTTAQAQEGPVGGLTAAAPDVERKGQPIAPVKVKPEIPFEISAVAARALEGGSAIRTAGTVQHILDQATVVDLATDVLPRIADDSPPISVAPLSRTRKERLLGEGDAGKRNGALLIGTGVFLLFLVIALVLWLADPFASNDNNDVDSFVGDRSGSTSAPAAPTATTPVTAKAVTVFDPGPTVDDTAALNAGHVLTDTQPPWQTSQWQSANFGNAKDGVGLMFRFAKGAKISSVTLKTPTVGAQFKVEIRTARSAKPSFGETSVVGAGTVTKKTSVIGLDNPASTEYLLVWITSLPKSSSGYYQAIIDQASFAGP